MTESGKAVRQSRKIGQAGEPPTEATTVVESGTNRVALGLRPKGTSADGGGSDAEMGEVEEKEVTGEAADIMMTETVNKTATEIGTPTSAQTSND